MFEKRKKIRILAIFLILYLSVGIILTGRGIVLRTYMRLKDLRLSSYSYNKTPRKKNRTSSKVTLGVGDYFCIVSRDGAPEQRAQDNRARLYF
jgi:hypothetical protein